MRVARRRRRVERRIAEAYDGFAGYGQFSAYQLKIIQEVITLVVFVGFAAAWLGEPLKLNHVIAFVFLGLAVTAGFWNAVCRTRCVEVARRFWG